MSCYELRLYPLKRTSVWRPKASNMAMEPDKEDIQEEKGLWIGSSLTEFLILALPLSKELDLR
jgi:hypothetical protein